MGAGRVISRILGGLLCLASHSAAQGPADPYRPAFHYTPTQNWINDPNGLVYHDGEYHLFYQHNPSGSQWGNMSWGHAVSPDLVNWEELPVAIPIGQGPPVFSGSAVIDISNTAGFGAGAMVAAFTGGGSVQDQRIAYSLDGGRSFTKYAGNPVIPGTTRDFRDPKVFWHGPTNDWVMAIVRPGVPLPERPVGVEFYRSSNLIDWTYQSTYGSAGWETPDLFQLTVDGDSNNSRWVLMVAADGGTDYHIGDFDGTSFNVESVVRADYGQDFYAAQAWNDAPNNRRTSIAWMSNWAYAGATPTGKWRGAMTLPRELQLTQTDQGIRIWQRPAAELGSLRRPIDFQFNRDPPAPLLDSSGTPTSISVTIHADPVNTGAFAARGSSPLFEQIASDATDLMREYLIAFGETQRVKLSGLEPGAEYDLVLYGAGDRSIRNTVFTVGARTAITQGIPGGMHELTEGLDYVRLNSVIADPLGSLDIFYDDGPGSNEGPFNGLQVLKRSGLSVGQTVNLDFGLSPNSTDVQETFVQDGALWNPIRVVDNNQVSNEFGEFGYFSTSITVGGPQDSPGDRVLINPSNDPLDDSSLVGDALELVATFLPGTAERFGLAVREGEGERTVIWYDVEQQLVAVDRNASGQLVDGIASAPASLRADGTVELRVFVDRSSVEVFVNDGEATITSLIFPDPLSLGVSLVAEGGTAELLELLAYDLSESAQLAGDYNANGVVDAADYTVWRDANGKSQTLPGDTTAGRVDEHDFGVWSAAYSEKLSVTAAGTPEPHTLGLLLLVVCRGCIGHTRDTFFG